MSNRNLLIATLICFQLGCKPQSLQKYAIFSLPLQGNEHVLAITIPSVIKSKSFLSFSDYNNDSFIKTVINFQCENDTSICSLMVASEAEGTFQQKSDEAYFSNQEVYIKSEGRIKDNLTFKRIKKKMNGILIFILQYNNGFTASGGNYDKQSGFFYVDVTNVNNEETVEEIINSLIIKRDNTVVW